MASTFGRAFLVNPATLGVRSSIRGEMPGANGVGRVLRARSGESGSPERPEGRCYEASLTAGNEVVDLGQVRSLQSVSLAEAAHVVARHRRELE